jgi:hypothetical protein
MREFLYEWGSFRQAPINRFIHRLPPRESEWAPPGKKWENGRRRENQFAFRRLSLYDLLFGSRTELRI